MINVRHTIMAAISIAVQLQVNYRFKFPFIRKYTTWYDEGINNEQALSFQKHYEKHTR